MREQMKRVANVGYLLSGVTRSMCPRDAARTGLMIDFAKAYPERDRPAIAALLGLSDLPQIANVTPESAADFAGLKVGDDIAMINGIDSLTLIRQSPEPALVADQIEERLASTPEGTAINLRILRAGKPVEVIIRPDRGCSARFIVNTGAGMTAFSDPHNVGLDYKLVTFTRSDDELALVASHELTHIINRDAQTKDLGQRGKEDRADVVGASIARCAGYDVGKALEFWRRYKKRDWLRFFRDPTHRSIDDRVALIKANSMTGECPPATDFKAKGR